MGIAESRDHDAQRAATDDVLLRHVIGWVKEHHGGGPDFIEYVPAIHAMLTADDSGRLGLQGR